jgi:hypothetical protein
MGLLVSCRHGTILNFTRLPSGLHRIDPLELEEFYALPDRSAERDLSLDSTSRLEPPDSDEVACRLRESRQPGSHEAPSDDDASPLQRRDERLWSWRSHSPETFRDQGVRQAKQRTRDQLEEEPSAGPEHSAHFRQRCSPIRNKMDRTEIEDTIEGRVFRLDRRHITDPQPHLSGVPTREPVASSIHHLRIEVERANLCRSESIHDDLDTAASATAHFEDPTTRHAAAEALQEWRDVLALHHGPQRAVHRGPPQPVQPHE